MCKFEVVIWKNYSLRTGNNSQNPYKCSVDNTCMVHLLLFLDSKPMKNCQVLIYTNSVKYFLYRQHTNISKMKHPFVSRWTLGNSVVICSQNGDRNVNSQILCVSTRTAMKANFFSIVIVISFVFSIMLLIVWALLYQTELFSMVTFE